MSTTNNGGPAFPTENERQTGANSFHYEGMTLRDYFAAKALLALVSGRSWGNISPGSDDELMAIWASSAYCLADAMLKARAAGQEGDAA